MTTLSEQFSVDKILTKVGASMSENLTQKVDCSNTFTTKNSQDETILESSQEAKKKRKCILRKNSHEQVITSRNYSRPKPPLPPLKEKKKQPIRRSSRQKEIKEKEVVNFYKSH